LKGQFIKNTIRLENCFPTTPTERGKRAAFKIENLGFENIPSFVLLTMSNPPHAIEVSPDTELQFTLSRSADDPSKCVLTLRHPGTTDEHLAFKVSDI
jgi:hypothetical protein